MKYTKEDLQKMTVKELKLIDIKDPQDEKIINEIIASRAQVNQPVVKFNYSKVPDIKTPAQEAEWQAKVTEFNLSQTPVEAKIAVAEKELATVQAVVEEVKVEVAPEPIVTPTVVQVADGKIIKPFCDKCDSKGVSHKKVCPLYVSKIKPTTVN